MKVCINNFGTAIDSNKLIEKLMVVDKISTFVPTVPVLHPVGSACRSFFLPFNLHIPLIEATITERKYLSPPLQNSTHL